MALAQGLTGLLAVTAAVLTFGFDRARKKQLVGDAIYTHNLVLVFAGSMATALIAGLTWWTWDRASTPVHLLFGWSSCVWMGLLFGGAVVASSACAVWAITQLVRHQRTTSLAKKKDP